MPKVLVADDSIAVRKVAERLLTQAGMGVVLAANGEEAMAYLAKDRPDVIVSDVIMPDKSGYEVCAFVRGNAAIATVPVLLISGIVNDEVTKQAEFCKADGVLKKPFQGTSLKDKVMELLAKRQASAAISGPEPVAAPIPARTAEPWLGLRPITAPAPGYEPMQTQPMSLASSVDPQTAIKLKEAEGQLRSERARVESLVKRISDLEAEVSRNTETEVLLEAQRRLVSELESKIAASAIQVSRVPQLEAALRAEQESAAKARHEAAVLQNAAGQIGQLEAALNAERIAAAQLVQQLTELEVAAARGNNAEAMLANEMQRVAEFEQKAREAEAELIAVRARMGESAGKDENGERAARRIVELETLLEAERQKGVGDEASAKVHKLEALLVAEREQNAALVHRVSETEQVAVNATKRFEEMARKLGEIAGLASQLGKGM
ncbi:MAG: response regulator [Nitrospira sp.]|nr:response regulator [Nitrospira sp.]